MVRIWHGTSEMFKTPSQLRNKLRECFPHDVSANPEFKIGYMEGNNKRWIVEDEDLALMYRTFQPSMDTRITLWCDSRCTQDEAPPSKKRKTDTCCQGSSEELKELDNSEVIFKELKTRHPDLPNPKLRLWAKMIDRGRHEDYDNPPNIPLITGSSGPTKKKVSVADALTTAATALASAIKSPATPPKAVRTSTETGKFSPMSGAKLRRSCLDDLKSLKELYQDAVITESEFAEQKEKIVRTLKEIN